MLDSLVELELYSRELELGIVTPAVGFAKVLGLVGRLTRELVVRDIERTAVTV